MIHDAFELSGLVFFFGGVLIELGILWSFSKDSLERARRHRRDADYDFARRDEYTAKEHEERRKRGKPA